MQFETPANVENKGPQSLSQVWWYFFHSHSFYTITKILNIVSIIIIFYGITHLTIMSIFQIVDRFLNGVFRS